VSCRPQAWGGGGGGGRRRRRRRRRRHASPTGRRRCHGAGLVGRAAPGVAMRGGRRGAGRGGEARTWQQYGPASPGVCGAGGRPPRARRRGGGHGRRRRRGAAGRGGHAFMSKGGVERGRDAVAAFSSVVVGARGGGGRGAQSCGALGAMAAVGARLGNSTERSYGSIVRNHSFHRKSMRTTSADVFIACLSEKIL